jgi:ribonucleotide monophosphatase NagD (HAD superfamily)
LWLYNNVIEGSNTVINRLLDMGKKVYFITNNSTKTREELAEKARVMNFNVGLVRVFYITLCSINTSLHFRTT